MAAGGTTYADFLKPYLTLRIKTEMTHQAIICGKMVDSK